MSTRKKKERRAQRIGELRNAPAPPASSDFAFAYATLSDQGKKRHRNEDSVLTTTDGRCVILGDGIGGHPSGDVASFSAVEELTKCFVDNPIVASGGRSWETKEVRRWLDESLDKARQRMRGTINNGVGTWDMGTTIVIALHEYYSAMRKHRLHVAHIGDSRAYLLQGKKLRQLTQDHAGEYIERWLGCRRYHTYDLGTYDLHNGDVLLVCSDGLNKELSDNYIASILQQYSQPEICCQKLIEAALASGGKDNITAAVVKFAW